LKVSDNEHETEESKDFDDLAEENPKFMSAEKRHILRTVTFSLPNHGLQKSEEGLNLNNQGSATSFKFSKAVERINAERTDDRRASVKINVEDLEPYSQPTDNFSITSDENNDPFLDKMQSLENCFGSSFNDKSFLKNISKTEGNSINTTILNDIEAMRSPPETMSLQGRLDVSSSNMSLNLDDI